MCFKVAESLQSCLTLCDSIDYSSQAPSCTGFSRQEYWSRLLCPSPGELPKPGVELTSLMSPALAGEFFTTSATWEALYKHKLGGKKTLSMTNTFIPFLHLLLFVFLTH